MQVNLVDILERSIAGIAEIKEGIKVEKEYPSQLPVGGDKEHIRKIVNNLLSNAAEFTPVGGESFLCQTTCCNPLSHV